MSAWPTVELGDVAKFVRGINFKPEDVVSVGESGSVACMRTKNVQKDLDLSDVWAVPVSFVKREEQMLQDGDILVSSANSWNLVGKCCWVPKLPWKATFGGFISVLRANYSNIEPRYLFHWFSSNRVQTTLRSFGQQTTNISNLNIQRCLQLLIPVPPLEEQRRIAEILDCMEALQAKRLVALSQLDELTQSTFIEMFGDPTENTMNWETQKFYEVGTLQRGKSKHRPRNAPELLGGKYPLIQTGDVANSGGYITEYTQTYSELGLRQSKMWSAGTLCITIAANIAKTGILTFDACFPDSVVGFIPNEKVRTEYVQHWMSFLQKMLEESAPESAQKNINLKILFDLNIPVPPLELQDKFVSIVHLIEKIKQSQKQSSFEINNLFDALMQKAFAGELVG